ncbi:hypothetical protein LEP1GSC058_3290 [Leptospira fainei serovar Hurstbridge str. BUT 6]|uniref:Uncharacterized protein n=1 Tax=Leptospira fainei serovar Hurstbridge str. BUT 6 TaxID=1193011 RepID=S3V8T4_9LEPT|nr:hypothetical protein LEP1GSC058_3290 [Leptospira fainei serovar Hurstbridge str. BUT 6]
MIFEKMEWKYRFYRNSLPGFCQEQTYKRHNFRIINLRETSLSVDQSGNKIPVFAE